MAVQVVHEKAPVGNPLHLSEEVHGVIAVEVVEDEGGVGNVHRVVGEGKGQRITNLHPHPRPERWREVGVQVRPGVADSHGIGVEAKHLGPAAEPVCSSDQMNEVVSTPTAHVEDAEVVVSAKQRIQHGIRRRVCPEETVDQAKIPESLSQPCVRDREVVHPLLSLKTCAEVGK